MSQRHAAFQFVRVSMTTLLVALLLNGCASTPSSSGPRPPTAFSAPSTSRTRTLKSTQTPRGRSETLSAQPTALPGETEALNEKERAAYREIYSLFSKAAYEGTSQRIREFVGRYPQSNLLPQIQNIQGLIYLFAKQPLQAQNEFGKALQGNKDRRFRQFVLFNQSAALVETQSFSEALAPLDDINPEVLDPATQIKFYYLRAQVKRHLNSSKEAVQALLVGSKLLPNLESTNHKPYEAEMELSIKELNDYPTLESYYRDNETSPLAPHLLLRLAKVGVDTNRAALAEVHIKALISLYPNSPQAAQARDLQSTLSKLNNVSGRNVGVLLPLTGKFSRFGTQCRQGIELAFGNKDALVFEDSGETPEQAVKALESLVLEKGVVVVIGPLLSKGIEQVTARAEELGVPIISLAQQTGVSGGFVFRASTTPKQQVNEIANYAVNQLGLKKFAILYPKGKFGQEYADAFWDKIESLNGEIVGIESYQPSETDFRSAVDKLAGLFYPEARYRELGELAKKRQEGKVTKRNRKTEELYALKPIVDFEAVFVPDEGKVVGQALPFFQYRDVDGVKFLGISAWNTPTLTEKLHSHNFETYFVDSFALDNPPADYREFQTKYQQAYDSRPSAMEASAYDMASLVNGLFKKNNRNLNRAEVRDLLEQTRNFSGVTGRISYVNGEFSRPLKVLTVVKDVITEVKRPASH